MNVPSLGTLSSTIRTFPVDRKRLPCALGLSEDALSIHPFVSKCFRTIIEFCNG